MAGVTRKMRTSDEIEVYYLTDLRRFGTLWEHGLNDSRELVGFLADFLLRTPRLGPFRELYAIVESQAS